MLRAIALLAVVLAFWNPAVAQVAAPVEEPILSPEEAAGFHRIFDTSAEQRAAFKELLSAVQSRRAAAEALQHKEVERWRAVPDTERTPAARREFLEKFQSLAPDIPKLRAELMQDLKALLAEPQLERWARFERFLRRVRVLNLETGWFFDRTNLFPLVELLELSPDERGKVEPLLTQYDSDFDLLLRKVDELIPVIDEVYRKAPRLTEEERVAAQKAAGRSLDDVSHALSRLHYQYLRRFSELLTKEHAASLAELYRRMSMSEAYGFVGVDEPVRRAPELAGLEEEKREKLKRIAAEFQPRWDELTRQIAQMERSWRPVEPGDEAVDMSRWDPVRIERGELSGHVYEKIKAILTEEQWAKLWEEHAAREREWKAKLAR